MTPKISITKELSKLHKENDSLKMYLDLKKAFKNGDYEVKYEKRRDLQYRN